MVVAAADDPQRQFRGVVERQSMVGLNQRSPHGFGKLGVLDSLQHRVLRGLEETLQPAQDCEREDVVAVGLTRDDSPQVGVRSLPYRLVERV